VLWELWLVGIVWVSLWDALGVAERLTQAIGMTPSSSFSLALQMCVFKVLNKQVRKEGQGARVTGDGTYHV
jgi:hypothetical protein